MRRDVKDAVLEYNAEGGELQTAFGVSPTGYPFREIIEDILGADHVASASASLASS